MHLNHPALEHIITELGQHLGLGGVHNIAEIHMICHLAGEGDLDRFRDRHGRLTGGKGQRNRA